MTIFDAIFLGLVQGLTEFLPVSSSGHLSVFQSHLRFPQDQRLPFDLIVHLATLLVVVLVFRRNLRGILVDRSALGKLALACLPLGLALFAKPLVAQVEQSISLLGACFMLTAVILALADAPFLAKLRGAPQDNDSAGLAPEGLPLAGITWKMALLIGIAQLLAVLPGVSRSGMTIAVGLLLCASPKAAAEFSFLIFIPATLGAVLFEAPDIAKLAQLHLGPMLAAFATSFLVGLLALWVFLRMVKERKLWVFAPYLLLISGACMYQGFQG